MNQHHHTTSISVVQPRATRSHRHPRSLSLLSPPSSISRGPFFHQIRGPSSQSPPLLLPPSSSSNKKSHRSPRPRSRVSEAADHPPLLRPYFIPSDADSPSSEPNRPRCSPVKLRNPPSVIVACWTPLALSFAVRHFQFQEMDGACTSCSVSRPFLGRSHLFVLVGKPLCYHRRWGRSGDFTQLVVRAAVEQDRVRAKEESAVDLEGKVRFLYGDLPHLFDDQGIDRTAYDDRVKFRDPITKYDSIGGYLLNIAMLRALFSPDFQLHWVKQTGPYEITTRWTMVMKFALFPWKTELVFTGTSVMGVNPQTRKLCSHMDYWDSIENNEYFSIEGVQDLLKQLRIYKTPDLESPKYQM